MEQLPQQLWNGIAVGAVYALIALGYTMVYGIIELINFAHGEIYMIGAYLGVILLALSLPLGLPLWRRAPLRPARLDDRHRLLRLHARARRLPPAAPCAAALARSSTRSGASIGLQQLVLLLQGTRAAVPPRELPPARAWRPAGRSR